ncbi:MAG: hybrid sensor histidine kinase/response regulator, partial [Clostridiales bacterium]|nr:hybrid sensor histidine kinase/response regulator [Clostridiales bacterium]
YILRVEDTGVGMSDEFLKHIYDAFSREDKATTSEIQGTGLGMAIVKRLVDYLDGTIDIESAQGRGTSVNVTLHLQLTDEQAGAAKTGEIAVDLAGKKVLLVEDNELNREIATDILTEQGVLIEEAVNGIDAVEHVKQQGADHYDFVLMDIQMPLMDGFEATAQIRKLPGAAKLPIIALSANAFEEDKIKSIEAGMNDHVAKPIVISELMAAIARLVKEEE